MGLSPPHIFTLVTAQPLFDILSAQHFLSISGPHQMLSRISNGQLVTLGVENNYQYGGMGGPVV